MSRSIAALESSMVIPSPRTSLKHLIHLFAFHNGVARHSPRGCFRLPSAETKAVSGENRFCHSRDIPRIGDTGRLLKGSKRLPRFFCGLSWKDRRRGAGPWPCRAAARCGPASRSRCLRPTAQPSGRRSCRPGGRPTAARRATASPPRRRVRSASAFPGRQSHPPSARAAARPPPSPAGRPEDPGPHARIPRL